MSRPGGHPRALFSVHGRRRPEGSRPSLPLPSSPGGEERGPRRAPGRGAPPRGASGQALVPQKVFFARGARKAALGEASRELVGSGSCAGRGDRKRTLA